MKKMITILLIVILATSCFAGCQDTAYAQIAATTLPVYQFTAALCEGTPLTVTRLITEEVACLHDYSLNVRQVRAAEAADVIVISGAGLEDFLDGIIPEEKRIDASLGIALMDYEGAHAHDHGHGHDHSHSHEQDPHIWLDPEIASAMASNICTELSGRYPDYADIFLRNLNDLTIRFEQLEEYGNTQLTNLSCREMITFHDGFSYFAQAFGLTILEAVEEESGSEASAKELIHLIEEVEHHSLPALFTEKNSSTAAAEIISRETGRNLFCLDMIMSGNDYFDAMYYNINTIKEALG